MTEPKLLHSPTPENLHLNEDALLPIDQPGLRIVGSDVSGYPIPEGLLRAPSGSKVIDPDSVVYENG